ncbi:MAG: M14 family metallopeptidase [Bacteroidota bacterium]|nr:M14 family metallopeptidase [Bacteroidota bacterium]
MILFISFFSQSQKFITRFEQSNGTQTPTYFEVIDWWKKLDAFSSIVQMNEFGTTDAGYPLHLILVSTDKDFNINSLKKKKKNILFILNGIHPGEPDGIDASMLLVRDIVGNRYKLPSSVVLAIIPVYNIGGALNRSTNYRIDQNGPVERGFRGNAQNLDLNRDFIKMDSKNAFTFARIFHELDPDVFVDNHVSNGADYQHVMTLLASQHNKLGGAMGAFMNKTFEPGLYALMKQKGYDLVPYVNHFGETPDKGWAEFWDSPRYSSGYATLWNTFAFVPETHMLKPYKQRVEATKALMECFIEFTARHGIEITQLREQTKKEQQVQRSFPLAWKWDKTKYSEITFKGYESGKKKSEVSGLERLYYDRNKSYEKRIPFYNTYTDTLSVERPVAYLIPQGWWKVIERLQANNVRMWRLAKDTIIEVESYRITNYQSTPRPYEGHHPNSSVQITTSLKKVAFRKGDYYIPLNQAANRFLIEVLEPQGEDSYFAWNFFDPILQQKEGFSDYVFEETAAAFLKNHPEVQKKLEERKAQDTTFANSVQAQLNFIFQNSPYYEPAHLQYPVYRKPPVPRWGNLGQRNFLY